MTALPPRRPVTVFSGVFGAGKRARANRVPTFREGRRLAAIFGEMSEGAVAAGLVRGGAALFETQRAEPSGDRLRQRTFLGAGRDRPGLEARLHVLDDPPQMAGPVSVRRRAEAAA